MLRTDQKFEVEDFELSQFLADRSHHQNLYTSSRSGDDFGTMKMSAVATKNVIS